MAVGTRSSEDIKKDIREQLQADSRIQTTRFRVEVVGGRVILIGAVPTYAARQAAQEDAQSIWGVMSIENRLEVRSPDGVAVADDELCGRVRNVIGWEADLEGAEIEVYVHDGWVTLRGAVEAYWKKRRAEEMASALTGVHGVTNELAIVPSRIYEDRLIAESIVAALDRNLPADVGSIDVHVQGGRVTLSGRLSNPAAFQVAEMVVENTPGVVAVDNDLENR